jgi:hypothetical protein
VAAAYSGADGRGADKVFLRQVRHGRGERHTT